MRRILIVIALSPLACAPSLPDFDAQLSADARSADYPSLVPLGPLLADVEAPQPRNAASEGQSLEARAANLRLRAAWLRNLPL